MGYFKDIMTECDNNIADAEALLERRTNQAIAYEEWLAGLTDEERAIYLGDEPTNFDRFKLEVEEA